MSTFSSILSVQPPQGCPFRDVKLLLFLVLCQVGRIVDVLKDTSSYHNGFPVIDFLGTTEGEVGSFHMFMCFVNHFYGALTIVLFCHFRIPIIQTVTRPHSGLSAA